MKIYDFAPSPNARKVRFVAYELGLEPTFVHVNIFQGGSRTPEFLALNPNGRIPVLEDGGSTLWESNAIITYLASLHPEKGLLPTEPRPRAEVAQWLFWQSGDLAPAIGKVAFERVVKKFAGIGAPDEAIVQAGIRDFKVCAAVLDKALEGKEFLTGRLSVADFAIVALLTIHELAGLDLASYPALQAWYGRMVARESVRRGLADANAAMGR